MSYKERIIGEFVYNPVAEEPCHDFLSYYIPARAEDLAGKALEFRFDNVPTLFLYFQDGKNLYWSWAASPVLHAEYDCIKGEDNIYMIVFPVIDAGEERLITMIWDQFTDLVTLVLSQKGPEDSPALVSSSVFFGVRVRVDKPLPSLRHSWTSELVGKRILWQYNPNAEVMHIFYSPTRMRLGYSEPKLIDNPTDSQWKQYVKYIERKGGVYPFYEEPTRYVRIRENFYLYIVLEENLYHRIHHQGGSELLVMLDTKRMRYVGRACGVSPQQKLTFGIIGAVGSFSNEPDEVEMWPSPYDSNEDEDKNPVHEQRYAQFGLK